MKNQFFNYIAWLFFPSKFIFPQGKTVFETGSASKSPLTLRIPGWETLELIADPDELGTLSKLVGETYLGGAGNAFLVPLFGRQSAFTLDGKQHRLARKLISQAVNKACIQTVVDQIPALMAAELGLCTPGRKIRIGQTARRITMATMCLALLGSTDKKLLENLYARFEATTGFFANFVSYNKTFWEAKGGLSVGREVERRRNAIDSLILEAIQERRRSLSEEPNHVPSKSLDLLTLLLRQQDTHGYNNTFIRDNLVSTIAAGYDTTGSAITWMLFWLNLPEVRDRIFELHSTDQQAYGAYADAFIAESLRYCPPLEILPRRPSARADVDPETSPTLVCPCPHQVHHNPIIYKNPDVFDPDRFLNSKFGPTEYFPFGAGNRLCLGVNLAPRIMRAILDWLIVHDRYFRFQKRKFRPIRRNVSLWPGFTTKGTIAKHSA